MAVYNVILPISVFVLTSFSSFTVATKEAKIQDRAIITLTMVLSFSAFKARARLHSAQASARSGFVLDFPAPHVSGSFPESSASLHPPQVVVAEYVPAVSYLTNLDQYMLFATCALLCVSLQNVGVRSPHSDTRNGSAW